MQKQHEIPMDFAPMQMAMSLWVQPLMTAWQMMMPSAKTANETKPQDSGENAGDAPEKSGSPLSGSWDEVLASVEPFQAFHPFGQSSGKVLSLGLKSGRVMIEESMKFVSDISSDLNSSLAAGPSGHLFQSLAAVYERQVCKALNMPQLGLTREYQERITQAADEFNHFVVSMAEFANMLAVPMKQAYADVNSRLSEAASDQHFSEDPQAFYKLWLQILEQNYMSLLSSPEFMNTLHRLLNRYSDYWEMQQSVIKDFLQVLPVSTKDDFDELAHDNYLLKKQLKALKKTVQSLAAKIPDNQTPENQTQDNPVESGQQPDDDRVRHAG